LSGADLDLELDVGKGKRARVMWSCGVLEMKKRKKKE